MPAEKTDPKPGPSKGRCIAIGLISMVAGAFPITALLALVYRFPIPFGGYMSGPEAMLPSLGAVLFYGLLGGFIVVGVFGPLAGVLGHKFGTGVRQKTYRITVGLSLLFVFIALFVLSVLDKIIGPW